MNFQNYIYFKTGNGGTAGRQTINMRKLQGKLDLKTCPGRGSQEAKNGVGGVGKSACLDHKLRSTYPDRIAKHKQTSKTVFGKEQN